MKKLLVCIILASVPLYATDYYVSPGGSNADGLSWQSAWNELGSINWTVIQPGDTIYLDGGSSEVIYQTGLAVGKDGTEGNPYVMTGGANSTETISFLAYRQNVSLVNLGMGSAVSVLLFLSVGLIAVIFVKGFKTDLSQVRGDQ